MENIDLKNITEEHLTGKWEVTERQIPNPKQLNPFSTIRQIGIQDSIYTANNGKKRQGIVSFGFEDLIYNPQLKFHDKEQQIANAIITRLYIEEEGKLKKSMLTLYFTTGLELILRKYNTI